MRRAARLAGVPQSVVDRAGEIGLRTQDHTIFQDLQVIGGKCRTGRRDIDDQISGAGSRRAFRGTQALHDPVNGNSVAGKE